MLHDEALELHTDRFANRDCDGPSATANSPPQADRSGTEGDETNHGTSRFASQHVHGPSWRITYARHAHSIKRTTGWKTLTTTLDAFCFDCLEHHEERPWKDGASLFPAKSSESPATRRRYQNSMRWRSISTGIAGRSLVGLGSDRSCGPLLHRLLDLQS